MKKFIAPVCSILGGALTFLFLSLPYFVTKDSVVLLGTATNDETAWQVLKNYDNNIDGYSFFKVAIIIMIVMACLSILVGLMLLLKNMNVLKLKANLNTCNVFALVLLVLANVVAIIAGFVFCNAFKADVVLAKRSAGVGYAVWLNLALSVLACVLAFLFGKETKKKKRK